MELQYYVRPDEKIGEEQFEYWKKFSLEWYYSLGFKKESLRLRNHLADERAHYAKAACDIEFNSPFGGWKEAWGIHHRGDWDLRRHSEYSKTDLSYYDDATKERFIPWDIECSGGVDRAVLFLLLESYEEDEMGGEKRIVLKLKPQFAPVKVAVFPLVSNKEPIVSKANEVYELLNAGNCKLNVAWDDIGNIGKRYRRQDEIGTPWCVTVDYQTLEDNTVTVRDRDTGKQERHKIEDLDKYFQEMLK